MMGGFKSFLLNIAAAAFIAVAGFFATGLLPPDYSYIIKKLNGATRIEVEDLKADIMQRVDELAATKSDLSQKTDANPKTLKEFEELSARLTQLEQLAEQHGRQMTEQAKSLSNLERRMDDTKRRLAATANTTSEAPKGEKDTTTEGNIKIRNGSLSVTFDKIVKGGDTLRIYFKVTNLTDNPKQFCVRRADAAVVFQSSNPDTPAIASELRFGGIISSTDELCDEVASKSTESVGIGLLPEAGDRLIRNFKYEFEPGSILELNNVSF